ncbi:DUF7768 domain-containing protein [Phytohabitans suffuscus]|uniref:DUF7768 domain-containing protein n=1 Tax=Phytohabitans suffuscus TaxID=624315 RepID=A0A6F8YJS4_9ACTN|nr:hypothetical protein [Phytohabitans suffuscus]BCB86330.1 hypothetical protein Psuf_036430 [Phytohabitans suffuscus]
MVDDRKLIIYTAQSKHFFYCRDAVCEFVFHMGAVPLNPFRVFDYFLSDRVSRDVVRDGNRRIIEASDEVWVFGQELADGVILEIALATRLAKPLRYFSIGARAADIGPIPPGQLTVEDEVLMMSGLDEPQIRQHIVEQSTETIISAMGRARELSGI